MRQTESVRGQTLPNGRREIPYLIEFDSICAFDVLEDIEGDEHVLEELCRALRPDRGALLSVPQRPFLWSSVDEISFYKRRYQCSEREFKCRKAKLDIHATSFVPSLLPLMLVQLLVWGRCKGYNADAELALPRRLDQPLEFFLALERTTLREGVWLPISGSRFVAARRRG